MTVLQKPRQRGDRHAGRRWYEFGHADQAVRHTDAWEHETFAEEQARWERSDPEYARICEQVRQARHKSEEASRRADEAKADWDARVATRRHADDDAQKARHELKAEQSALRHTGASRVLALRRQLDLETRVAGRAVAVGDPPGVLAHRQDARQPRIPTTLAANTRDATPAQPDADRSINEGSSHGAEPTPSPPARADEAT
jgi:hypothetical protein